MRPWLIRALVFAAVIEIVYLMVFNLALNLPVTQTLINKIRLEKFAVYWDRAWTWHPFRVHARGMSANGQSRTRQWQVDAPAASGSSLVAVSIFSMREKIRCLFAWHRHDRLL